MRRYLIGLALLVSVLAGPALALEPSDLNPVMTKQESDYYDTLKGDPASAESFLVTRDYVRKAQAVVDKRLDAKLLPSTRPIGFSSKYLLPEDPSVINIAEGMYYGAMLSEQLRSH